MSEPDPFKINEAIIDLWRCYTIERDMAKELESENARLKAEVERLTKAGDELHAFLINYIVESRISSAYLNKLDDGWNAAKEGKEQP